MRMRFTNLLIATMCLCVSACTSANRSLPTLADSQMTLSRSKGALQKPAPPRTGHFQILQLHMRNARAVSEIRMNIAGRTVVQTQYATPFGPLTIVQSDRANRPREAKVLQRNAAPSARTSGGPIVASGVTRVGSWLAVTVGRRGILIQMLSPTSILQCNVPSGVDPKVIRAFVESVN